MKGVIFVFLLYLSLLLSGCIANHPKFSLDGRVVGGHEKLNSLLKLIKTSHVSLAKKENKILEAWYSGVVCSPDLIIEYNDELPTSETLALGKFKLLYPRDSLDDAKIAVLTEVVIYSHKNNPNIECDTKFLVWNEHQWHIVPAMKGIVIDNLVK